MSEIITRKCAKCKGEIEIEKDNISSVLQFQDKYYHSDCFISMAEEKAASKRGKPQMWQDALDHVWELEAETKKMLEHYFARDALNVWLLENYDVATVPNYFWQLAADLNRGVYKNKRCKPISTSTLYLMWRWGQKRLDKIAADNKRKNTGPKTASDRIRYDLAILLTHTDDYKRHIAKIEAEHKEAADIINSNRVKINYNTIAQTVNTKNLKKDTGDVASIIDDIF